MMALAEEVEEMLASCFTEMIRLGQGPSLAEMRSLVAEYIKENNVPNQFKENYPGTEWAHRFMKRHKLRLKKGTSMQMDRKERTSDPFIIYSFYDVIEKEVQNLQLQDKPGHIYNLDETSFPLHSTKTHTLGVIGQQTVRVTASSGRQNITVLATICADGSALPPCIVFKGKRLMQQWIGDSGTTPNQTIYCVSDSGWMTAKVFYEFFVKFVELTKDKRPILLILDGHVSHTTLETVKLARAEQISIVLLPPHCTDVLQPLDKVCFAPLKNYFDQALTTYEHTSREPVSRQKFVQLLTSVWGKGLSEEIVRKSFSSTGVFPINRNKFDVSRLSRSKVEAYNRWILAGRPETEEGLPIVPPTQEDTENAIMPGTSMPKDGTSFEETSTPLPTVTGPSPCSSGKPDYSDSSNDIPKVCQHSQSCCLYLHCLQELAEAIGKAVQTKKSMEQIISDRQRPQQANKPGARRMLGKGATVITHEEVISSIEEREKAQMEKETKKKQRAENQRNRKLAKKKQQQGKKENKAQKSGRKKAAADDDDSSSISSGSYCSKESRGSSLDVSFGRISPESGDEHVDEATVEIEAQRSKFIEDRDVTTSVQIDDESINKYFAVVYTEPKKQHYWGKVTKVFSEDDELPVNKVEMVFLRRKTLSSMPEKITWQWPPVEDKHIIDTDYIFMGPCSPDLLKNGSYRFDDVKANDLLKKIKL